ncbi:MAG: hypothetical protein H0U57_11045 [Tatlockia sp.]|nr:hypothetical protein [Tatlockia sp.]
MQSRQEAKAIDNLHFVKTYVENQNKISKQDKDSIKQAKSVGEIALILFHNGLFRLYQLLDEHLTDGIRPSMEQMAQLSTVENTNGWYSLIQNDRGIELFIDLMAKGFRPSYQILTRRYTKEKKTLLEILVSQQANYNQIFYKKIHELLQFDILKSTIKGFVKYSSLSNTIKQKMINADSKGELYHQIFSNNLFNWYEKLLAAGINPTAEDMDYQNDSDERHNWSWLTNSIQGLGILLNLVKLGILPSKEILTATNSHNENLWYLFTQYEVGIQIFKALLTKNCLPDSRS